MFGPGDDVYTIGIAWSTFFRSRGWSWIMRLAYAYRAPTLFAAAFAENGAAQAYCFAADEHLEASGLDGTAGTAAQRFAIAYLAAHGRLRGDEFELVMHHDDWRPATSGLDGDGPLVVVFDACDLTDLATGWERPWEAQPRPRLRLVLGFASLATVGKAEALRGTEFAERVARGEPVAAAWIAAVRQHAAHRRDRPVAIAFGANEDEAEQILDTFTLADLTALPLMTAPSVVRHRT